jgi:hypothetical protein
MDINSKTVQELLISELSIMNATIEAQRFKFANENLKKCGEDLVRLTDNIFYKNNYQHKFSFQQNT